MPVVELSYDRLLRLTSPANPKITKEVLSERLPYLGLDIESDDGDAVRIEYSPNRPDYATDIGVSMGLQGILGIKKGPVPFAVGRGTRGARGRSRRGKGDDAGRDGAARKIRVSRTVSGIRPILTGIIARGRRGGRNRGGESGPLDDALLRQLVTLQEDLHFGLGRNRKKVAIGLHDLSKISGFPLEYRAVAPEHHRFVPLGGGGSEMTIPQILRETNAGVTYGHLISGFGRCPVILDSDGNTVSMPPVINSEMTAVTTDTADVLVEVTGNSRYAAESVLAVVAVTLHAAGFDLEPVAIEGGGNRTPPLEPRTMGVSLKKTNEMLGLELTAPEVSACLEKCRLRPLGHGAATGGHGDDAVISCVVPPYRPDITSEVDLIEEVALGYGTWRIKPVLLPPRTFGGTRTAQSRTLRDIDAAMVGMGYLEALNSGLTSSHVLYEMAGRATPRPRRLIATVESKSSEHTILRDSLLPGLVENLSRNIHEAYPQRLFETGTVFSKARRGVSSDDTSSNRGSSSNTYDRSLGAGGAGASGPDGQNLITETAHVAAVSAHADSSFSEAKSVLQSMLDAMSYDGRGGHARTVAASHHMFADGRCAKVLMAAAGAGRRVMGYVGEIDPKILSAYRIRVAAAGFELSLPEPAPQR